MAAGATLTPQQAYAQAVQANQQARAAVLQYAVKRIQQVFATTISPTSGNGVLNIAPQNVGLIQGFLVEVDGNIQTTGNVTINRTEFGVANALSNITFADLSNYVRHNTTGWHMSIVNSAKQGFVWGAAMQPNVPEDWTAYNSSFANTDLVTPNWSVRTAPNAITNGNANIREIYYVPIAYSSTDLRGAIYAAVTNATMNLQLTINQNPVVASGDNTGAIYSGAAGTWNGNVTVTVYQIYYDQLPTQTVQGQTTVILPLMDLNNQYCLLQTALTGMLAGQDFPYPYANFRNYLSTVVIVDNIGQTPPLSAGSEINYIALTSANNTNIWKYTPQISALLSRQFFMSDMPLGTYYFDTRQSPLNTVQFGNINLNFNPNSNIESGARLLVGVEYFAQQTQVSGAQSLAAS